MKASISYEENKRILKMSRMHLCVCVSSLLLLLMHKSHILFTLSVWLQTTIPKTFWVQNKAVLSSPCHTTTYYSLCYVTSVILSKTCLLTFEWFKGTLIRGGRKKKRLFSQFLSSSLLSCVYLWTGWFVSPKQSLCVRSSFHLFSFSMIGYK